MRHLSCLWILLGVLSWVPLALAAKPPADEFAVPLQATAPAPRSVPRGPVRIRTVKDDLTGESALQAGTARDAIAAAVNQRAPGCRMIRFGTGFGWVATGMVRYPTSENPVAARRSAREARFKAFQDARIRLAGCLSALSPEARRRVTEHLEQDDAIRLALINLAANDEEKREQALRILARGFVAYSAEDDSAQHAVYVNLVTTPGTATRLTRPTASAIEAASLQEGLRQIQAEIGAGLIPSAGHRLIVVNATSELALAGYAANQIGTHPDPAAQDKLRADAEKIATTRATEALVGLATGDDAAWKGGLDETSQGEIQATASGYDDNEPSARRFGQIHDLIVTTVKDDTGLQALREGRLPSAATIKRFGGESTVSVAVIYTPVIKKRETRSASLPVAPPAEAPPASPPAPLATAPVSPPVMPASPSVGPAAPTADGVAGGVSAPPESR
ncbi:MAG: hypothetical protein RKP20_08280 [Candidatus Competibacter sp.]|nr:hypothetical protein [Candidatus Competibacter sp.]